MSKVVYDVRKEVVGEITEIIFADPKHKAQSVSHSFKVERFPHAVGMIQIADEEKDDNLRSSNIGYVVVSSASHAKDLMKALEKAIDLGWIK